MYLSGLLCFCRLSFEDLQVRPALRKAGTPETNQRLLVPVEMHRFTAGRAHWSFLHPRAMGNGKLHTAYHAEIALVPCPRFSITVNRTGRASRAVYVVDRILGHPDGLGTG
jgi:hypothetical protein